jgi:hypothetical protein
MGFSVLVEMLNLRLRRVTEAPVSLRDQYKQAKFVPEGVPLANMPMKTPMKRKTGKKRR